MESAVRPLSLCLHLRFSPVWCSHWSQSESDQSKDFKSANYNNKLTKYHWYLNIVVWEIFVHQLKDTHISLQPDDTIPVHSVLCWRGKDQGGNSSGVYYCGSASQGCADHVWFNTISPEGAALEALPLITLFKTTTARLRNNKWNVSTCQSNFITCQICISATRDLDSRFCRRTPVHLVTKMWRLSVTMTTASPVQALRRTISCLPAGSIFPWPSTVHVKEI